MSTTKTYKTSYEILQDLCKIRNDKSSFYPSENPITNRVEFIINELLEIGIEFNLDIFNDIRNSFIYKNKPNFEKEIKKFNPNNDFEFYYSEKYKEIIKEHSEAIKLEGKYANIEVCIKASDIAKNNKSSDNNSIIFIAHHDILNPKSENCNDNSASVCNLLRFIYELQNKQLESISLVNIAWLSKWLQSKNQFLQLPSSRIIHSYIGPESDKILYVGLINPNNHII